MEGGDTLIETLKSILISLVLFAVTFCVVMLFLVATEIGRTIMAYVAGFFAWIIISLAVL